MKEFKGRIVTPGTVTAPALVSHGGLNTLASFQGALQFGDKKATCGDQNNPDLHGKELAGKALCLPQTIGSTTGGLVLYAACAMDRQPACMLFSKPIDSLAAAGAILASVWLEGISMPVVDSLGDEFINYVKDGMKITIKENESRVELAPDVARHVMRSMQNGTINEFLVVCKAVSGAKEVNAKGESRGKPHRGGKGGKCRRLCF